MQEREVICEDGCRLFCRVEGVGNGAPVVFSHSLGCTLEMWDEQAAALAATRRVIRYDSRGHGRSDAPSGDYSNEMLGRDAMAVFNAFGLYRTDFVGLSMGGMTGMWLGANAPDRIDRLVLANTTAKMAPVDWDARLADVRANGMQDIAATTIRRWLSDAFKNAHPDMLEKLIATMQAMQVDGYIGSCAVLRDSDLRPLLGRIGAPALVVAGGDYGQAGASAADSLVGAIPGARLALIPAAQHLSNIENPSAFNAALMEFLG